MENIIAKANDLYESLVKKLQEVATQKAKLDKESASVNALKQDLSVREKSINEREKAIKQFEDLMDAQTQAKIAKKEAQEELRKLTDARSAFETERDEQNKKNAKDRNELSQQALRNSKEFKKLQEDRIALEEEKKDIKAQVLKEIGVKIGA